MKRTRAPAIVLITAGLMSVSAALRAEERSAPGASEIEEAIPEGGSLTGRQIYERFLENKFKKSLQELRVISRDPGGNEQVTHFTISLQDHRDGDAEPVDGVNAKMLVEVQQPFDMRHTAYLIISKEPGPDDEFVYQPSQRRVKRVDLKNTSLLGTDYTFNDIAFQNIEDAEYRRLPDEVIDGTSVYVVEANVKETIDVEYHRTISYLEKDHYVPLRTRYWDDFGVEVKEMTAPNGKIRQFDTTWVATESTMRDLRQQTSSTLLVDTLDTKPDFHRKTFTVSKLNRGH
jgi:hypothetical protein